MPANLGPDLALVGAARSGTSYLAAALAQHDHIDAGVLKEPNFFSGRWGRSTEWYDGQFQPRSSQLLRLDASVSYTYPRHPLALSRLRDQAPSVRVVYAAREPLSRLVSHYQLVRYYSGKHELGSLGEALERDEVFLGAGDYGHWLRRLRSEFAMDRVLVVPFSVITRQTAAATDVILTGLGLGLDDGSSQSAGDNLFRNDVRDFRHPLFRAGQRLLHQGNRYQAVRKLVGPDRMRRLRSVVTKPTALPTMADELASLSPAQRARIDTLASAATVAVSEWLADQDHRLGLDWASLWSAHTMR